MKKIINNLQLKNKLDFKTYVEKFGLVMLLIFLILFFSSLNGNFLSLYNIQNIFKQSAINGLIAYGMTFVILLGCIDLSVGSILVLVGYMVGMLITTYQIPALLAITLGLGLGVFLGIVNGYLVAKIKLQPFIATLITMTIYRGLTLIASNGLPVRNIENYSDIILFLNKGTIGPLPISMVILIGILIVLWVILNKTIFGRHLYATGGNEEAARLSTINTSRIKIIGYAISGFLSAIAAILYISRYNSIYPDAGQGAELDAIAAVVIGGTSMSGGKGLIVGTFIGALVIGVLNNGLNLLGVSSFYQEVIKGSVILLAVIADKKRKK